MTRGGDAWFQMGREPRGYLILCMTFRSTLTSTPLGAFKLSNFVGTRKAVRKIDATSCSIVTRPIFLCRSTNVSRKKCLMQYYLTTPCPLKSKCLSYTTPTSHTGRIMAFRKPLNCNLQTWQGRKIPSSTEAQHPLCLVEMQI